MNATPVTVSFVSGRRALQTVLFGALLSFVFPAHAEPILWVDDAAGILGKVDVATGDVTLVGNMGVVMTDIAFAPNGDLYAISFTDLYQVDPSNANATLIGPTGIPGGNALVFGADGTLYAAANSSNDLYSINLTTGAATSLGSVGDSSSGDLAFVGGQLYMSGFFMSQLVRIQLSPSVSGTPVGPIGFSNVYGLATPGDGTLYGVTGTTVLTVDRTSGAGTQIVNYGGAGLGTAFGSSFVTEAIPEPTSQLLAAMGSVGGLAGCHRRRRRLAR